MNIKGLHTPLPSHYIQLRPARSFRYRDDVYVVLLAYKDARVDMDYLDQYVGEGNWRNSYYRDDKGNLVCKIEVNIDGEWVSKENVGVESYSESEKGEYSDAFKRAGFLWGIGRHLYRFPEIIVKLEPYEVDNGKPKSSFRPRDWNIDIEYGDNGEVVYLKLTDKKGKVRYEYNR